MSPGQELTLGCLMYGSAVYLFSSLLLALMLFSVLHCAAIRKRTKGMTFGEWYYSKVQVWPKAVRIAHYAFGCAFALGLFAMALEHPISIPLYGKQCSCPENWPAPRGIESLCEMTGPNFD